MPLIFINGLMTDPAYSSFIFIKAKKVKKNAKQSEPRIQIDLVYTENIKFHRAEIRQMIWAYSGSGVHYSKAYLVSLLVCLLSRFL